jgi:outer membrane protein assembly factor BamA
LLKQKGISAEVQTVEPSSFALTAERAPGAPAPAIIYSILSPTILVDKVIVSGTPDALAASLKQALLPREGREYSGGQDWMVRSNIHDQLEADGYLDAQIDISHDSPRASGDHYQVNLLVAVTPGPQYRVGSITADGGPLLVGRDLSSYFSEKPGDIAGAGPFGHLAGELRALYWRYGYADVDIDGPAVLDRSHATVSYHLEVVPGPLYHLRSLTLHNLDSEQEQRVRDLLGMKPGDVFDEMAINGLYHKLSSDTLLKDHGFTFSPTKDKATAEVDLTLEFYKNSDKSSVTVQ